jgi:hypothetical protein
VAKSDAPQTTKSGRVIKKPNILNLNERTTDDFDGNGIEDEDDISRNARLDTGQKEDVDSDEDYTTVPKLVESNEEKSDIDWDDDISEQPDTRKGISSYLNEIATNL